MEHRVDAHSSREVEAAYIRRDGCLDVEGAESFAVEFLAGSERDPTPCLFGSWPARRPRCPILVEALGAATAFAMRAELI
jgi:hypothetical protein